MPFSAAESASFKNDWFDYNEPYPYPLHDSETGATVTFSYEFDEKTGIITIYVNYITANNEKKILLCIFEKDKEPRINRITTRTINSSELCLCINDRAHNALDNYGFFMHECHDYYTMYREI